MSEKLTCRYCRTVTASSDTCSRCSRPISAANKAVDDAGHSGGMAIFWLIGVLFVGGVLMGLFLLAPKMMG